jgi:hypothetical protein
MTEVPPWCVEHGIANGHPTDRVIQVLNLEPWGVVIYVIVLWIALSVYMEGGNVRIFSAWMEGYLILLFNVL